MIRTIVWGYSWTRSLSDDVQRVVFLHLVLYCSRLLQPLQTRLTNNLKSSGFWYLTVEIKKGKLGVGNVFVLLNLHECDRQEATKQWKLKRWLTNPNGNFDGTYELRSALTPQTRPPMTHLMKKNETQKTRRIFTIASKIHSVLNNSKQHNNVFQKLS